MLGQHGIGGNFFALDIVGDMKNSGVRLFNPWE